MLARDLTDTRVDVAQEIMGLGPASGLCCGYTMTRAILSDAIALVRGECFTRMQPCDEAPPMCPLRPCCPTVY